MSISYFVDLLSGQVPEIGLLEISEEAMQAFVNQDAIKMAPYVQYKMRTARNSKPRISNDFWFRPIVS